MLRSLRSLVRRSARFVLAALLFTQFSVLAQACLLAGSPAMAFADRVVPTLHIPDQQTPSTCLAHLKQSDQSPTQNFFLTSELLSRNAGPIINIRLVSVDDPAARREPPVLDRSLAPPAHILFSRLLA